MESTTKNELERIIWIDWMRVASCFMVILVHSTEPFYLGGDGALIITKSDAFWASFFDSSVRACVPLFIIASSYLQFPIHYPTKVFFIRRLIRIIVPFLFWTVVYALVWGEPVTNFKNLLMNFNYAAGHLWFIYMLVGLYLLMPILSPWAEKVSKKELLFFLCICGFTTLIPLFRDWLSGSAPTVIYGPSGLARQALYPLWGEASWNAYGTFYYFSGVVGYMLLGLYFKRFVGVISWKKTLAIGIPAYLVGFVICFGGFLRRVFESGNGTFPVGGLVEKAVWWETTWCNDTIGVALMALAWLFFFRKFNINNVFYRKIIAPLSKASYGIYLIHLFILVPISVFLRDSLGIGTDGCLGVITTPVQIISAAIVAFLCTSLTSIILQRIPKIGKYIAG